MKPVLLLDIDGVINAISREPETRAWPEEAWVRGWVKGGDGTWPILAAQPVIDFINRLHDQELAEVRWHTTWQHEAQNLADFFGLRTFAVAEAPEYLDRQWIAKAIRDERPTWWKLSAALRVLQEEKRPLIWIDDELSYELRKFDWPTDIPPHLALTPNHIEGITARHIQKISYFIDEVTT